MNTLLEVRAWVLKTLEQDASQVPPLCMSPAVAVRPVFSVALQINVACQRER